MVIYTTLKANKEHGIDMTDIAIAYEESYGDLHDLFDNADDWDAVFENNTERQIASAVLKQLKSDAKDKDMNLINWTTHKVFIDIDAPEIAFMEIESLIEAGVIAGSSDLREIERLARKRGCTIKSREYCYDTENHYYTCDYIDDLIEKHFPCNAEIHGDCINCGNCN